MRPLTCIDIVNFYNSERELLILDIDNDQYKTVDSFSGNFQIILEREHILTGVSGLSSIDEDGNIDQDSAEGLAEEANDRWVLPGLIEREFKARKELDSAQKTFSDKALGRAHTVAKTVEFFQGNQSSAGRALKIDQSQINRLVKKASASKAQ